MTKSAARFLLALLLAILAAEIIHILYKLGILPGDLFWPQ